MLGGDGVEVVANLFDEERAAGFVGRTGNVVVAKTPFRDPARLALGRAFRTALGKVEIVKAGRTLRRRRWVPRLAG
jgi:hypothetical protein